MALRAGRVGVNPADVNPIDGHINGINYSTSDEIIGKWVDGKYLHRKVIEFQTPSTANVTEVVSTDIKSTTHNVVSMNGVFFVSNLYISVNYGYDTVHSKINIGTNGVNMTVSEGYIDKPCTLIVEYTLSDENVSTLSDEE